MKLTIFIISFILIWSAIADNADYLTGFKIPVQQTFCISMSLNGDMDTYKQCMLAVEKESYKCDKATKPDYEKLLEKYSNYDRNITAFVSDIKPITKTHIDCLSSIYKQ